MADPAVDIPGSTGVAVYVTEDRLTVLLSGNLACDEPEKIAERVLTEAASLQIAGAPDAEQLARLLRQHKEDNRGDEALVLVKGRPAIPPRDGQIEWGGRFFDRGFVVDESTGVVDYRSHAAQVAVHQGQLLARVFAPEPGQDGRDVFGKRLPTRKPIVQRLRAGANVNADESGSMFYAAEDGRVRFASGVLTVDTVYRVSGDVDLSVGHITHPGAVVVEQDVLEGAKVEAAGDIEIIGSTEAADIVCGGTLVVHGSILGGEGRTIRASGNIHARLIMGADVEAGGDVLVEREIVNCRVKTRGKVEMPLGRLVGGEVTAHGGVRVGQLGSPGAVRTVVIAGEDFQLENEIKQREEQADETRASLAALEEKANVVRQRMHRLSVQQQETAMLFLVEVDRMRDSLRELCEEMDHLREESLQRARRAVGATSAVHPETFIGMDAKWLHIKDEVKGPVEYRFLNGSIVAGPLRSNKEKL